MAKTKISEFSSTPANNTDIDSINLAEGCAPSGINDAIRELMAQLKDFQTGAQGDSFNGPIGSSTAATGAFTTLSASSTVTLSGGTANGVAYLNGSKVVTSGSALTFDGTSLAVGDTASSADGSSLYIYGNLPASTQLGIKIGGNANSYTQQAIRFYDTYFGAYAGFLGFTTNSLTFGQGTTEGMRLTSTGLGIGTSSPATKLQVYGGALTVGDEATYSARFSNNSNKGVVIGYDTTNNVGHIGSINPATAWTDLVINANGGNLGLGVTPSAWSSSFRALQVKNASLWSTGNDASLTANAYYDGTNYRYIGTNGATRQYHNTDGSIAWSIAASGTAGDAITFTQALTLTAGGNLLVGTTTNYGSRIIASAANGTAYSSTPQLRISGGSTNNNRAAIVFSDDNLQDGKISYYPAASASNSYFSFSARATESDMILDGSGNLLVGTTGTISGTNAAKQVVYNNTASQSCFQAVAGSSHTGVYAIGAFSTVQSSSGSNVALVVQSGNGSTVNANNFFVYTNGNVTNTNNSYGAISDVKLKENIVDATPKLANLMQVKVRNYNLIGQTTKQLGVVAQELETVFPAMVNETPDRDTEGNDLGTTTKSVKYSVFVPMLIKAIQELKAEFDAYKASHP